MTIRNYTDLQGINKYFFGMKVCLLSKEKENEWDQFVDKHKDASVYFKVAWRNTISEEFGHEFKYYYVESNGKIIGILPLFFVNSFLSKVLISLPYCPYGGVLSYDVLVEDLLVNKAIDYAKEVKANYIELKEISNNLKGFVNVTNHVTFKLPLSNNVEQLRSDLSKSTKRHINKGEKLNYTITYDSNIEVFYDLYLKHLKKIGTPTISKNFFKILIKNYGSSVKIATIWYDNIPAASILLLISKNKVIYDRGATNYKMRHLSLNYVLFWEVIKKYAENKFEYFDFGRSVRESGTFQFKNGWRPLIEELNYQYYILKGKVPNHSQSSWKRKIFTRFFINVPRIPYLDYHLRKMFP